MIDSGNENNEIDKENRINRERQNIYRQEIEPKLAEYFNVPIIRLVIGTHSDKLFSIKSALNSKIPCLFLKVIRLFEYNVFDTSSSQIGFFGRIPYRQSRCCLFFFPERKIDQ